MFVDRIDAGQALAARLRGWRDAMPVVIGLPRGGVPVAAEVAEALGAPLDVIVAAKVGLPGRPELAVGAVGEGGVRVLNTEIIRGTGLRDADIPMLEAHATHKLRRQTERLRAVRSPVPLRNRTVIIVDDGIATGATAIAACRVARQRGAARVVLAAPVIAADTVPALRREADEVVSVEAPWDLVAVGHWYADFTPTTDAQVRDLLRAAGRRDDPAAGAGPIDRAVTVEVAGLHLPGHLGMPSAACGLVVFAHGSGSSAASPRNRHVAEVLHRAGLGTLLFDLLTPAEAADRRNVFDIELLAGRLAGATGWALDRPWGRGRPVGWFGASTGVAAALVAAAAAQAPVAAIVSRGGRPDLAGRHLAAVRAPTLLIVGGADTEVLALNRAARTRLTCPSRLFVVPGATHLFEEPGTLDAAAALARDWFLAHLPIPSAKAWSPPAS